jgi:hypothetical protein
MTSDAHFWPVKDRGAVLIHDLQTGETETMHETDCPIVEWQTSHPPKQVCHPHPVWSADGRRVYFNAVVNEMPQLCVADVDTGEEDTGTGRHPSIETRGVLLGAGSDAARRERR